MSVEAGHGTEGPTVDTPCGQEQGDPCPQGTPDVVVGRAAPTMPARPTGAGTRRGTLVLRVFGAALIVIVTAIAVFLLLPRGDAAGAAGTPQADASSETALAVARAAFDANNASADSAPKQQVVNGWYANDLGVIEVNQRDAAITATRATNTQLTTVHNDISRSNELAAGLTKAVLLVSVLVAVKTALDLVVGARRARTRA